MFHNSPQVSHVRSATSPNNGEMREFITKSTNQLAEFLGVTEDQVVGHTLAELIPPEAAGRFLEADAELLEQLSPINKVDRVVAPTIVLHGANDTNVPVVEAEQVVASLEERGVPVQYVLFPDEGHGWRKTENRIASDVAIVKWFVEHL